MKLVATKNELEEILLQLDLDASLAVCFVHGALDAQTIIAIRNAERLCDAVVVVNLSIAPLSKVQCSLIERAGGSFIYQGEKISTKCVLDAGVGSIDATLIMQTLITVMPHTVTVAENNTNLIKVLKNIQDTFGQFFTLQIKATPVNLLSVGQKRMRECLVPVLLEIQSGESEVEVLKGICTQALKTANFSLIYIAFVDGDTLEEHVGVVSPTSLLLVEATLDGHVVKDILSLFEK
mgnify:FL=1